MRTTVRMVQKRLPAPPLFWRPDMTAFAGVMLALVWMFVGPALIIVSGVRPSVDLPFTNSAIELRDSNREDAMFVGVERDGSLYFNSTRIRVADLRPMIRDSLNRGF